MNLLSLFFVLTLAFVFSSCDHNHSHHHHESGNTTQLQLNAGKKWATDTTLREKMMTVKRLVHDQEAKLKAGTLPKSKSEELNLKLTDQFNAIFNNCKLSPKADEQLHLIMASLIQGNNLIIKKGKQTEGYRLIHQALTRYPKYFDHPEF